MFTKIIMSIHSTHHNNVSVLIYLVSVIDLVKHYDRRTLDSIYREYDFYQMNILNIILIY